MTLGARLRVLRLKQRESLQQVADAVGASKPHIWELERGRSSNPSLDLLTRIARHFDVTVAYLVGENAENEDASIQMFGRDFKDLSEEDWDFLRQMAMRLKSKSPREPTNEG